MANADHDNVAGFGMKLVQDHVAGSPERECAKPGSAARHHTRTTFGMAGEQCQPGVELGEK